MLLNGARDRARANGLSFSLSRQFVEAKLDYDRCEISGLPLVRESPGKYRTHPLTPSLDRINPSMGYVEGNVRLVCFAVNRARSDFGDDFLFEMAKAIVLHNNLMAP